MPDKTLYHSFKTLGTICVIILIVTLFPKIEERLQAERTATQIEQYCYVEAKSISKHLVGSAVTRTYELDVYVVDSPELKDTISVPPTIYKQVEVGMEVKCMLYYTNEELVKIEFVE